MYEEPVDSKILYFTTSSSKHLHNCLLIFICLYLQVGVGFLAQYMIKPMLGFVIAMVLLSYLMQSNISEINISEFIAYSF